LIIVASTGEETEREIMKDYAILLATDDSALEAAVRALRDNDVAWTLAARLNELPGAAALCA